MKPKINVPTALGRLLFLFTLMFIMSCGGPTIQYLGESYSVKEEVDVYYDEKDVENKYKTIGQMTNDKFINYEPAEIRKEMIKEAKRRGADGIVFFDLDVEREHEKTGDKTSVKAKLIQYIK